MTAETGKGATARQAALVATLRAKDDLVRAARSLPADRLGWRPQPHAPSAVSIVAHCAAANLFFAAVIGSLPLPYRTEDERRQAIASCTTLEQAESFLNRSVTAFCDALVALPEGRLAEQVAMPWGERMPLYAGLWQATQHMLYHEGQINYIQLLLGDDEHH